MVFHNKNRKGSKKKVFKARDIHVIRKQQRKSKRKEMKIKKHEFFSSKKNGEDGKFNTSKLKNNNNKANVLEVNQMSFNKEKKPPAKLKLPPKKKKAVKKLTKEEENRTIRVQQLQDANEAEDKVIKRLEKDLRLNKRKSKSVPKSFVDDGLDYLLEFCNSEKRAEFVSAENTDNLHESGSEFEEDFAVATGKQRSVRSKAVDPDHGSHDSGSDYNDSDLQFDSNELSSNFSDEDENGESSHTDSKLKKSTTKRKAVDEAIEEISSKKKSKVKKGKVVHFDDETNDKSKVENMDENAKIRMAIEEDIMNKIKQQRELKASKAKSKTPVKDEGNPSKKTTKKMTVEEEIFNQLKLQKEMKSAKANTKKSKINEEEKRRQNLLFGEGREEDEDDNAEEEDTEPSQWEDIYGRTRDHDGNVLPSTKYVPPHLRASAGTDKAVERLRKQMKGLLNRLAESNVKSIADQIDALYSSNSRHDTSEALTALVTEAIIAPVLTPDRLVAEHVLLIAILHANVGSEVGAHLLQAVAKRFEELFASDPPVEDKHLDNVVLLLAHLYNFKVFASVLAYDVLNRLTEKFGPKEIELIILFLKTVGANLRKDNPLALKDLIGRMQVKAGSMVGVGDGSRVRFTMDVLLAIKNNNMTKIPNYDTSHADHLKKIIKSFLRQGNYVSELSISLDDLVNADERGRWWVVGSAWSGTEPKTSTAVDAPAQQNFSAQLLALARKQRMNTETRRTIFCIVMTAEDYLDAFEKLIHLGLKNQREREIVHVLLDCCLQEKTFNPYYVHLANKFCVFDRKYQMAFQYLVWDKLKELAGMGAPQMNNLAKFLSGMFMEPQGLPLSVLKVIHFAEVDKPTVRLVRRTLLSLLLADPVEDVLAAFARVAHAEKLRLFREGLRLFLHHFVLRNTATLPEAELGQLQERVKLADQTLSVAEAVTLF